MPRIENLGPNVQEWYDRVQAGTSTFDVCRDCYGKLAANPNRFNAKLVPYNGDPQGTEGWGGDVYHPSYAEEGMDYRCAVCTRRLTARDDDAPE